MMKLGGRLWKNNLEITHHMRKMILKMMTMSDVLLIAMAIISSEIVIAIAVKMKVRKW